MEEMFSKWGFWEFAFRTILIQCGHEGYQWTSHSFNQSGIPEASGMLSGPEMAPKGTPKASQAGTKNVKFDLFIFCRITCFELSSWWVSMLTTARQIRKAATFLFFLVAQNDQFGALWVPVGEQTKKLLEGSVWYWTLLSFLTLRPFVQVSLVTGLSRRT